MNATKIKSYNDAKEYLKNGKNPLERPYANNTRIRWNPLGHDNIEVTYHGNIVVTFYPDCTSFSSCGWRTLTTKQRLNWFMPNGFSVWQNKGVWILSSAHTKPMTNWVFADGLVIDNLGQVHNAESDEKIQEIKALTKKIKKYVNGYVKALINGKVKAPSGGDCWYCAMRTDSGESLGDATKNTDHLESHFDESYYVPSLIYNAYKKHEGFCLMSQDAMARLWQSDESLDDWQASILERDAKSLLTKYLKMQFNIAS